MKEELAQQLKDAGFPGIKIGEYFSHRVGSHSDDYGGDSDYPCHCNDNHFPTLSELIEECRDGFCELTRYDVGWRAYKNTSNFVTGEGATPEEAVAHLWLELNKKV